MTGDNPQHHQQDEHQDDSTHSSPSAVDLRTMETQLSSAIQEYKSLRALYGSKLKIVVDKIARDEQVTEAERTWLRDTEESLRTASAAIESELRIIGSLTKEEESSAQSI